MTSWIQLQRRRCFGLVCSPVSKHMATIKHADGSKMQVGDRVVCDEQFAVIKFIGEVPPTPGVWLGVEWDDEKRGKHNGSHKGKYYFSTKHPKSGSFVRSNKVDGGISALSALHERYGLKDEGDAGVVTEDLFVVDQFKNATKVEMVGAKKVNLLQSQYNKLQKISFFEMRVHTAGPEGELGRLCPQVKDVDLSRCLLPSWERVAEIAGQFNNLKEINVSENRLSIPKDPTSLASNFSRLRNVTLNGLGISWAEVLTCCSMFPCLQELHLGFNNISQLSDDIQNIKGLKTLDIMTNAISDWSEILKLAALPNLETLLVSENQIKSIYFPDCGPSGITECFSNLKILIIKRCEINEWSSINELNKLASMDELQMCFNPVIISHSMETVRQLITAKLGRLKIFARTPITYDERKGAEIDYLKRFGTEWRKEGGSTDPKENHPSQEFKDNHPRYQGMADRLGAPEDSELIEKSTALKDTLLAVKIISDQHPQRGTLNKKLPGTMSIQKLKTMIQRMYKMTSEPTLSYKSHLKMDGPSIDLDNDMRQLGFFSIESEDTLLVSW